MDASNLRRGDAVRLTNGDRVVVLGFSRVRVPQPVRQRLWHFGPLMAVEPHWLARIRHLLARSYAHTETMVRVSTPERAFRIDAPSHLVVSAAQIAHIDRPGVTVLRKPGAAP